MLAMKSATRRGRIFVDAGSVLRGKSFGVGEEVREERTDDVLRPLRCSRLR